MASSEPRAAQVGAAPRAGAAAPLWLQAPDRDAAWIMAGVLIGTVVLLPPLNLWLAELRKSLFDALKHRDAPAFKSAIVLFSRLRRH